MNTTTVRTTVSDGFRFRSGHLTGSLAFYNTNEEIDRLVSTVRFNRELLNAFRATGQSWQTRMNDPLKEWLENIPLNMA